MRGNAAAKEAGGSVKRRFSQLQQPVRVVELNWYPSNKHGVLCNPN